MIVRLIFEKEQPIFRTGFRFHGDFNRARIDFIRFIHFGEFALAAEALHGDRRHIHERHGPRRVFSVQNFARFLVIRKGIGNRCG